MFPSYLLEKLVVRGSMKNNASGFEIKLKNIVDSGTLCGMSPLVVDDNPYPPQDVILKVGEVEKSGDQITRNEPMSVRSYVEILVSVKGTPLKPGSHKLTFQVQTFEAGRLQFSVTETLTE
jgi:hypothetical protein